MVFSAIINSRKRFALYLEDKIGAPSEQIIIITTMVAVIPFSFLNYLIKGHTNRLLYAFIIGILFHISIYGINSLHSIISTLVTYYFIKLFGRKLSPVWVLLGVILHLSYMNIERMIFDFGGWAIDDISTIYLVHVAKISSFAFSYDDGAKDLKELKSLHLQKNRIVEYPSLLEYAAYIFFYPTTLVGPFIEFKDFINFIDLTDCYANLYNNLGYVFCQGCQKLSLGIFFTIFFAVFGDKYPMFAVGKAELRETYPYFWQRLVYMYLCGPVGRAKYYVAWLLTYSSLIFSGMSYGESIDKKTGKLVKDVEKGSYGSILYNEFGISPTEKMRYWNNSIHNWLKYNIYVRVLGSKTIFRNNKVIAAFCTYAISAIWHGFYPSYYISFAMIYLFEQDGIFLNEIGFYDLANKNIFIRIFAVLMTTFFYDIIGSIFYCLGIGTTKEILINYKGLPVNAIVSFYVFTLIYRFFFMKGKKVKAKDEKTEKIREINEKDQKDKKVE